MILMSTMRGRSWRRRNGGRGPGRTRSRTYLKMLAVVDVMAEDDAADGGDDNEGAAAGSPPKKRKILLLY